ncbi:MAG: hypothetical protein PHW04_03260 [Candidatus Wallbacteria bacterium]|nr:hypothetical protein [Candidatus Wallbacteria bacterium]
MLNKPALASEYKLEQFELVKQTCLHVATKLGNLMDEVVVVGGLVPSLLIDQDRLPTGAETHAGTIDLDIGLSLALFKKELYKTFSENLRDNGFKPDKNPNGRKTSQRWRAPGSIPVTVDFLIQPDSEFDKIPGSGVKKAV